MPTAFPPPVNVSPLIKFFRWSFLLAGVAYGTMWQKRYTSKELAMKDIRLAEKEARDKKLAEEKLRANEEQMLELGRQLAGKKPGEP